MIWLSKKKIAKIRKGLNRQKSKVFVITSLLISILVLSATLFSSHGWRSWTGIGEEKTISIATEKDSQGNIVKTVETVNSKPGKTGWDFLGLVGIPLALLTFGSLFQQQQRKIADEASKEEALQSYFDRISAIVIDKRTLKQSYSGLDKDEKYLRDIGLDVIRARTLSILRRFEGDGMRKGSVISFLLEIGVLRASGFNLKYADLTNANLRFMDLSDVDLSLTRLDKADLSWTNLARVKLYRTNLKNAKLSCSYMIGAKFKRTSNIQTAFFEGAQLGFNSGISEDDKAQIEKKGGYFIDSNDDILESINPDSEAWGDNFL